jgi:hypothetical protein
VSVILQGTRQGTSPAYAICYAYLVDQGFKTESAFARVSFKPSSLFTTRCDWPGKRRNGRGSPQHVLTSTPVVLAGALEAAATEARRTSCATA